jgi:hypothetical protein
MQLTSGEQSNQLVHIVYININFLETFSFSAIGVLEQKGLGICHARTCQYVRNQILRNYILRKRVNPLNFLAMPYHLSFHHLFYFSLHLSSSNGLYHFFSFFIKKNDMMSLRYNLNTKAIQLFIFFQFKYPIILYIMFF